MKRFRALRQRVIAFWCRYLPPWLAIQAIFGLVAIALVIRWTRPYLTGWRLALAPVILLCGGAAGLAVSRRIEFESTPWGLYFSEASLVSALLVLVPVFLLRIMLRLLHSWDLIDTTVWQRMLLYFVPGVFISRAVSLLVKIRRIRADLVYRPPMGCPVDREVH
jgi:hypothetical protein